MKHSHPNRTRGAALISAMLTVALVAALTSATLWLQWRQVEIEIAERGQAQSQWLMTGAFDWSRLILAEDARTAQNSDHLNEPWALVVQESRLSSFLAQDQQLREDDPEVYLSGQIIDAQSRLNLTALLEDGLASPTVLASWQRLFQRLNLPLSELDSLLQRWPRAVAANAPLNGRGTDAASRAQAQAAPLLPRRLEQLVWLGLSATTVERLRPYATVLPSATPVNINTAPALVLEAVLPGLDSASASQLVQQRRLRPWNTLQEAALALGASGAQLDERRHSVSSRYFEILGRLRMGLQVRDEVALVERNGNEVRMLWRQRSRAALGENGSLQ